MNNTDADENDKARRRRLEAMGRALWESNRQKKLNGNKVAYTDREPITLSEVSSFSRTRTLSLEK